MTDTVTRSEFKQLKDRVVVLEREVDGEKTLTRHIFEQTRRNSQDLAEVIGRLDRLETKFDSLVRDLPGMVAGAMREVLDERKG